MAKSKNARARKSKPLGGDAIVVMLIVAVLLGWIAGFLVGNNTANSTSVYVEENVPEASGEPVITLLSVQEDVVGGYNIYIETENFTFTPNEASESHVDNQGHAHIYVDGKKVGRVYGPWYHLPALEEGEHVIKVELNGNDHATLVVDGKEVSATVTVDSPKSDDHTHSAEEAEPHAH